VLKALDDGTLDRFSADIDPFAVGLYLVDETRRLIVPRGDDARFADVVLEVCRRERIDVLVPTVDSELVPLASRRELLAHAGTELVLAAEETLRMCLDKWTLHQRCAGAVPLPRAVLVDDAFAADTIPLPAMVKPRVGSGSRGVRLVHRATELEQLARDGTLIVQEYLPGLEHSLDTLARPDGTVIAVVPRARLKIDSGVAVVGRKAGRDARPSYSGVNTVPSGGSTFSQPASPRTTIR